MERLAIKNIKLFLLMISIVLIQVSCNEKWLEPDPLSFFAPENVYVDEAGFESLLVTMRRSLKREYYGFFNFSTAEFAPSDLGVAGYVPDFSINTPTSSDRVPYGPMFDEVYGFIKNANVLISRIDGVTWDDETVRNRLLAEAYWHRAYWYYRLTHSYGDVPYIGVELTGAKLDFQTHSRWAILEKIQSDLEWAVEWMPVTAAPRVPTKGAGNYLLTKIYLANTEFDKAIEAATRVIEGPYSLMEHRFGSMANDPSRNVIWDLHRHENIHNSQNTETILGLVDRWEAPDGARVNQHLAANFMPHYWDVPDQAGTRGIVYPSDMMDTLMRGQGIITASNFYQFKLWEDETYNWQNTPDLRRADINWIEMSEIRYNRPESPNLGEPIRQLWPNTSDTTIRWYSWPHYKTYNPSNQEESTWGGGNGDSYVYRLAGIYLLRAEAYFWNNQLSQAANDINMVRARSNAPLITGGDVTIDYLFDERARELYAEETRHSEMVRVSNIMAKLNMNGYSLNNISQSSWWFDRVMAYNDIYKTPQGTWWRSQTPRIQTHNIYWPIPQSVITANTMGKINQNRGYQGSEGNVPPLETIEE
ncbi:RagB/SusD family nutrient uptake outer membrane protein [Lunatibacter salilacus]|uniref:RagB/SusD family nutrient uptake outer membrane protein n=1 Tax=Lunatibacter salilacus TaxID=2483804 RepID=UPI001F1AB176|nr:RagB/SusD family nutrient uptake outer membrane protein [Lunatibacter salilacus]